jgi:hypothetical protein
MRGVRPNMQRETFLSTSLLELSFCMLNRGLDLFPERLPARVKHGSLEEFAVRLYRRKNQVG